MTLLVPLLAVSMAAGLALGAAFPLPPAPLLALCGVLCCVGGVVRRSHRLHAIALIASAGAGGWSMISVTLRPARPECHIANFTGRQRVHLWASVVGAPVRTAHGHRQLLEAHAVRRGLEPIQPACGHLELRRPDGAIPLRIEDRLKLWTRLRPARRQGVSRLRMLSQDVGALAHADDRHLVVIEPVGPSPLEKIRDRIRTAIQTAVQDSSARGILLALLLGERGAIDPEVRRIFARAGASHLLAVSGLHLSLVAGSLFVLLGWLMARISPIAMRTDPRRIAGPLAAVAAVSYSLLTGGSPSTVRACVMVCACFLGLAISRPPDTIRPLALAGLVLLILDPLNLFRPGFQLSFAAVLGIACVAGRHVSRTETSWFGRLMGWCKALAATTAAATLITAPVVAHHFHQASVVGLLTNMVAIPLTTFLLLPLALLGALVGVLHPSACEIMLALAGWLASGLHRLCEWVSRHDWAVVEAQPDWLTTLGLCAGGAALLARGSMRWLAAVLAVALLGAVGITTGLRHGTPALEVVFLDVGQGDSTFFRFPDGTTVLVDAGGNPSGQWDPGQQRVVPYLREAGVKRLDLVVATHPHPDHLAGLGAVLGAFQVGELWVCWHGEPDPWHAQLIRRATRRKIRLSRPRLLRRAGVTIRPLWPLGYEDLCADPAFSGNDNSVVLRIEYGRSSVLMSGDVEEVVESELGRLHGSSLRSSVLKVPHHGSATSSSTPFLDHVMPELAVLSCAEGNLFGFPDPDVLSRYAQRGISIARVDLLGGIGVRLTAEGEVEWSPVTGLIP